KGLGYPTVGTCDLALNAGRMLDYRILGRRLRAGCCGCRLPPRLGRKLLPGRAHRAPEGNSARSETEPGSRPRAPSRTAFRIESTEVKRPARAPDGAWPPRPSTPRAPARVGSSPGPRQTGQRSVPAARTRCSG